jgi:hypothetical protein
MIKRKTVGGYKYYSYSINGTEILALTKIELLDTIINFMKKD